MDDRIIAEQQAVADRFLRLGLIPAPIEVQRNRLVLETDRLNFKKPSEALS